MVERRFKNIAVLMGGWSSEHEVSLKSGATVTEGLRDAGYDVNPVVMQGRELILPEGTDAVFIAMHGGFGENGELQAELNALRIPYTFSGEAACSLAMDKEATRRVLDESGVPVPEGMVIGASDARPLELPLVVKPPLEGSSVGVHLVMREEEWAAALADTCSYGGRALVERFIPGRELTVGVLNGRSLPVLEIEVPDGWYDFNSKYNSGKTRYTFPGAEESLLCGRCRDLAEKVFSVMGARGAARVDFRVNPAGEAYVLELNAVPGLTATSLLPKAAERDGLIFSQLCATLVELAEFDGEEE